MSNRWKYKICWWLAWAIPARVALYAFVRVHATLREAPESDGEYSRAYKRWVKETGIVE